MDKPSSITWKRTLDFLWVTALIGLPLTSFPVLVELTGAIVAPFSFIPIAILIVVWLIPHLFKSRALPKETTPFWVFLIVAVIASAAAFFIFVPGFRDKSVIGQELRAFVTLAIGASFFLIFSTYLNSEGKLKRSLQWINIGGMIAIAWGIFQIILSRITGDAFPIWFVELQSWISYKSQAFAFGSNRTSGLTYEASWYVHQLNMLYVPIWLAFTYERKSLYSFRILKFFTLENILLAFGVLVFFTSNPRIGLLALLLMLVTIFVKIHVALYRRLVNFIEKRKILPVQPGSRSLRILTGAAVLFGFTALYGGLAILALYFGSLRDWRLALLWNTPPSWTEIKGLLTLNDAVILMLGWRLAFLERTVYWITGWHIFSLHPFLGVGLGNSGFFFLENVPAIGWGSYEVRDYLYHMTLFPNTKSLWIRLLAETGITGFLTFAAWLYVLLRSASVSLRSKSDVLRPLAFAGQLAIIALVAEGFSIDSFAMPYLWVITGLIAAAGMIYRKSSVPTPLSKEL